MGKMTVEQILIQLMGGMLTSVQIFVVTLVFSLPLGLVVAFGRMSANRVVRTIVKGYISVMRGTPLMLQLMVVYFGPYYIFGLKLGSGYRLWAALIGFVINYVAFNLLTILVYQESFLDQLVVLGLSLRRRNIYVNRTQNLLSLIVILVLFLKTSQ